MAASNHYGANYKKEFVDSPKVSVDPDEGSASLLVKQETYATTSSAGTYGVLENGDTLYVFKPKKGERFLRLTCQNGANGAGVTFAFGIVGTTDKFKAATAAATAGQITSNAGVGYEFDGDTAVIVTVAGANCDPSITNTFVLETYQFRS